MQLDLASLGRHPGKPETPHRARLIWQAHAGMLITQKQNTAETEH